MRGLMIVLWALWGGLAHAEGEPSGEFDYYVLALSWSPNWCAREGDARGAAPVGAERVREGRLVADCLHRLLPACGQGLAPVGRLSGRYERPAYARLRVAKT